MYRMNYTGLGIIRCSSLLKLLKLQAEPLAYRLNGDVQWAHLWPKHWVLLRVASTPKVRRQGPEDCFSQF